MQPRDTRNTRRIYGRGVGMVCHFECVAKSIYHKWVFQNRRISTYEKSVRLYMVLKCSGDDILS